MIEEYSMSERQILEEVLFDWFPNAETDQELEYELECISWGDD